MGNIEHIVVSEDGWIEVAPKDATTEIFAGAGRTSRLRPGRYVHDSQLRRAVEALRELYRVALDMHTDADDVPKVRAALVKAGAVLDANGGQ